MKWLQYILILFLLFTLGCTKKPPQNMDNSCAIFQEKSSWYAYTKQTYKKWGVPIHVQLAIIHQESRFTAKARPPKDYLLWFIPWGRVSSAYGYAQVKDGTWDWYKEKTGNRSASRSDFADATDFIGWYGDYTYKTLGVSKWDAYSQYLAYHEGHGGFKRKTYLKKPWLVKVAQKVKRRAGMYQVQLKKCQGELDKPWWRF
ncbi:MAG TPA: hypothetical protein EYP39_09470 [Ghiorsea sp.]|nr:hypothetical protein [Ghiorsea sp.]HIP08027.1 hypothetical protein [Mariprofundaceae bacterium]